MRTVDASIGLIDRVAVMSESIEIRQSQTYCKHNTISKQNLFIYLLNERSKANKHFGEATQGSKL